MKQLIITAVILIALSVSCYYDTEESLYPDLGSCDTTNVSYYGSIVPLMENNCLNCHGGSVAAAKGNSINLEGYKNVFDNKDYILGSIRHDSKNKPMPKDLPKLKDCLIQQYQIWYDAGALEY
jgi:hypothetical protein